MRALTKASTLVLVASFAAACGQDIEPTEPAILTRPTAITFACYGDLIINPGPDQRTEVSAQPLSSCLAWANEEPPEGQESLSGGGNVARLHAFVTQSAAGTMAMLTTTLGNNTIRDTDPLTPGKNAIPIGTLPIDSIADESGCYIVTANAGTCDLSTLNVTSAASTLRGPEIGRIAITNAMDEVIDAKPSAIVVSPQTTEVGNECPAQPTGIAYVAYPDCNLVAAVDLSTGVITGGLRFLPDGSAVVTDGNVSCRSQCGGGVAAPPDAGPGPDAPPIDASTVDASAIDAGDVDAGTPPTEPKSDGTPRPATLDLEGFNGQLLIGAENSNTIVIATLDANGSPETARSVTVEGEVGILKVRASDRIQMGGNTGSPGGTAGDFQFVYAIASDRTTRVVDLDDLVECDTQVDPRFLRSETNVSFLSCMPVGGPDTPPRRAGARSPGIDTPRGSTPLDLEFATVERQSAVSSGPDDMAGTYAFVTTSDGFILIVNIDDDVYADLENTADPEATFISQAIAHQLRDFVIRDPSEGVGLARDVLRRACALPDDRIDSLPPRLSSGVFQVAPSSLAEFKSYELPSLQQIKCEALNEDLEVEGVAFLAEMAFATPALGREKTFPDLRRVLNEQWAIAWQGPLSRDAGGVNIDGPPIRAGVITAGAGQATILDGAAPFCDMGVEPFDIVQFAGCDPSQGDSECGLGEECFVHPSAPATLASGTCLPSDRTDILAVECRDFLISNKTYSVTETRANALSIVPRRRVLQTTPVGGCESDTQCMQMADVDRLIRDEGHPIEVDLPELEDSPDWVCAPDPSRAPGPSKCQMACETSVDCGDGFSCDGAFCAAGPLPPPACTSSIQRYQVNGGESFVVIGSSTGFQHGRMVSDTGECVDDPDANPLLIGRIPLRPPACTGDSITDLTPNPCVIDRLQQEAFREFDIVDGRCEPIANEAGDRERTVSAIRFSNPTFQFHMVDAETTGDLECRNDRLGTFPSYTAARNGFEMILDLTGGFIPMFVRAQDGAPISVRLPTRIEKNFDGRLWILDQGDINAARQGRVIIIDPASAGTSFSPSSFDAPAGS